MSRATRYPAEARERAVRMVFDHEWPDPLKSVHPEIMVFGPRGRSQVMPRGMSLAHRSWSRVRARERRRVRRGRGTGHTGRTTTDAPGLNDQPGE